jgi:hypothetical protein
MENSNKNPVSFTLFPRGINPNPNETNQLQWNLSNPTHQWTREMCRIAQDVGILGFILVNRNTVGP